MCICRNQHPKTAPTANNTAERGTAASCNGVPTSAPAVFKLSSSSKSATRDVAGGNCGPHMSAATTTAPALSSTYASGVSTSQYSKSVSFMGTSSRRNSAQLGPVQPHSAHSPPISRSAGNSAGSVGTSTTHQVPHIQYVDLDRALTEYVGEGSIAS